MKKYLLLTLPLTLLLGQCHKKSPNPAKPEDQLPAATQTGADTFGCLVNGQPYTPNGNNGSTNYAVLYDPTFQGGTLQTETYRYLTTSSGTRYQQSVSFTLGDINHVGTYEITGKGNQILLFTDYSRDKPCDWYTNGNGVYTSGTLVITRLDNILSGTFSFTLAQPGCDSIKITQGRFDKKL
jgi:hypothetical protein